jgi:hypothetical protein
VEPLKRTARLVFVRPNLNTMDVVVAIVTGAKTHLHLENSALVRKQKRMALLVYPMRRERGVFVTNI